MRRVTAALAIAAAVHADRPLQVVFSAECSHLFDWHTVGIFYSFEMSGFNQVANLTRLLACNERERLAYPASNLGIGPTFVHRNMRDDPLVDEKGYPSYNKPYSVMAWLEGRPPLPKGEDEYVLMTDADMVFTGPIDPQAYGAARGVVISAEYSYLIGTETGFAKRFIDPALVPRLAQVGGFHIFHVEDLRAIAPLWLEYTKRVRAFAATEPELFFVESMRPLDESENGLREVRQKQAKWHSEMYGYVFAAAVVGVTHHTRRDVMLYPGYQPWLGRSPYILHYGSDYTLPYQDGMPGDVYFNKMSHTELAIEGCPGFLFGAFGVANWSSVSKRDALSIQHLAMLDGGLCRHYGRLGCPAADSLRFCEGGDDLVREILLGVASVFGECKDEMDTCGRWASAGECKANPIFMYSNCAKSCGTCHTPLTELFPDEVHMDDWKWKEAQAAAAGAGRLGGGDDAFNATAGEALTSAELLLDSSAELTGDGAELSAEAAAGDPAAAEALLEPGGGAVLPAVEPPIRPLNPRLAHAQKKQEEARKRAEEQKQLYAEAARNRGEATLEEKATERMQAAKAQRASAKSAYADIRNRRQALSARPAGASGRSMIALIGLGVAAVALLLFLRRAGLFGKRHPKKLYQDKCAV